MTLHEALVLILRENGNQPLVRQLADAVNERGLYRRRDGSPVEIHQVHARIQQQRGAARERQPMIRLWEKSPMISMRPAGIELFKDDERVLRVDATQPGWLHSQHRAQQTASA